MIKKMVRAIFPFLNNNANFIRYIRKSIRAFLKGNKIYANYLCYKISKKYGCFISPSAKIGSNIVFPHPVGIVIGSDVEIGNDVTIYQHVTIGRKKIYNANYPKIGNNVIIYAGAQIIGDIKIGNNCIVGANAVVIHDLPDNCVAVGVPAKIIEKK